MGLYIKEPKNLLESLTKIRKGKTVVFTNGCFDILHVGHATYLQSAKSLGDILIVAINSDESVKRLKGPTRPINSENDRGELLSHLKSVDFVTYFNEDTPLNVIKLIKPDILVKGGDWPVDKIVGSDFVIANGGQVKTLEFVDGKSTTNIINKAQAE